MLKIRSFVLVLALFVLTGAPAQSPAAGTTPAEFTAQDRANILEQIHGYFAAFSAKRYESFPGYMQAPFLGYGREPVIIATLDEVIASYRRIRDPLDQADYSSSKAANIRLMPQTPVHALAGVHWQRLKKDGSLLDEGAEILVMNKVSGTWKMAGVLPQQLKHFAQP